MGSYSPIPFSHLDKVELRRLSGMTLLWPWLSRGRSRPGQKKFRFSAASRPELLVQPSKRSIEIVSNCLACQEERPSHFGFQGVSVLTIAFKITNNFRIHATNATFAGLPAERSRS